MFSSVRQDMSGKLTFKNVWVNKQLITNILTFFKIAKPNDMHITYDNKQEDAFIVSHPKNGTMKFIPSKQGLYYFECKQQKSNVLVNTAAENKEG